METTTAADGASAGLHFSLGAIVGWLLLANWRWPWRRSAP
jgi:hypothetical protein